MIYDRVQLKTPDGQALKCDHGISIPDGSLGWRKLRDIDDDFCEVTFDRSKLANVGIAVPKAWIKHLYFET
jgi:hypothetical protein